MITKQWILKQTVSLRDTMLENLRDMERESFAEEVLVEEAEEIECVEDLLRAVDALPIELVQRLIERIMQPEG